MNVVGNILHSVRELFRIGNDFIFLVSFSEAPAVVDDHIFISAVLESALNNKICGFHNYFFVYVLGKCVP